MKRLMLTLATLSLAQRPLLAQPTFSDANWASLGGLPCVNGYVSAVAVDSDGNLYIGGSFTTVGGVFADNVAKWKGTSWSALGAGVSGSVGRIGGPFVSALAVSGTNLYVGGGFTNAGGVPVSSIAQWNGSAWSGVGSGVSGSDPPGAYVSALAVSCTNLYVAGAFTTAGGVPATNIAQWNGSCWSALGSGISGLDVIGGYGGGGPPPLPRFTAQVSTLAVMGSNLFVGGSFNTAGGVRARSIAQWNGSAWSPLGSGVEGDVCALAVLGTNLFAGGYFISPGDSFAQWNGNSWTGLGVSGYGAPGASVCTLAVSGSNLLAGGVFDAAGGLSAGGLSATNIAWWDGDSWSALGSGVNGAVCALAFDHAGNVYVASFTTAGTNSWGNIAKALLNGPTPNQLLLANSGSVTNVITYLGIPGANYALDLATSLAPPVNWMPQMTNTASIGNATTAGYLLLTNHGVSPQGFYRMRSVP